MRWLCHLLRKGPLEMSCHSLMVTCFSLSMPCSAATEACCSSVNVTSQWFANCGSRSTFGTSRIWTVWTEGKPSPRFVFNFDHVVKAICRPEASLFWLTLLKKNTHPVCSAQGSYLCYLDAFAKQREQRLPASSCTSVLLSACLSVCLSVCLCVCLLALKNSAPTGHNFIKFYIGCFHKNLLSLKSDKNGKHVTWRLPYIYVNIS
jgi:hypothetical protein